MHIKTAILTFFGFLGSMLAQYMALFVSFRFVLCVQNSYLRCFKSDFDVVKGKFGLLIE